MCAGAKVETHELRLHPYLFPVGLGGAPTFAEGGDPTRDAKEYWNHVRRALLREPVDRLGLGGYLHLVQDYPDFCDYIEQLMDEFRTIRSMHGGGVYTLPVNVAVLHSWGSLRSWTLSGHFHETYMHDLIHINESLAGLPVNVKFISFADVENGALSDIDIVINAGRAGTAWSGGAAWKNSALVAAIQEWVYQGGCLIGVGEPSATEGFADYFRMAQVLGVDEDTGAKVCHGKWQFEVDEELAKQLIPAGTVLPKKEGIFLTDGNAKVLGAEDGTPVATVHAFGAGKGIYLSGYRYHNANTRMLLQMLLYAKGLSVEQNYLTDCADTECAYYPSSKKLVVINNSDRVQTTAVMTERGKKQFTLQPFETQMADV